MFHVKRRRAPDDVSRETCSPKIRGFPRLRGLGPSETGSGMTPTEELVHRALQSALLVVDERAAEALASHLDLVIEANQTMNLTSIHEPARGVWLHIVDSLLGVAILDSAPEGRLCDLGSGAGFPGIPLALVTSRSTVLVESIGKKAAFLRETVEALGLDAEVVQARAEQVARDRAGRFAVVTARALSALPSVLELAAPLLEARGRVVAYKGDPDAREIARGDAAAERLGLRRVRETRFTLGGGEPAKRLLIEYQRVGEPTIRLPRREGLAQHSPLA
jgi:16S rRNA (guanine527-N7)-methyltransferase